MPDMESTCAAVPVELEEVIVDDEIDPAQGTRALPSALPASTDTPSLVVVSGLFDVPLPATWEPRSEIVGEPLRTIRSRQLAPERSMSVRRDVSPVTAREKVSRTV